MKPQTRILLDEEIVIFLIDVKAFAETTAKEKTFIAQRLRECPDLLLRVHDISLVLIPLIEAEAQRQVKSQSWLTQFWNGFWAGFNDQPFIVLLGLFLLPIIVVIFIGSLILALKGLVAIFLYFFFLS